MGLTKKSPTEIGTNYEVKVYEYLKNLLDLQEIPGATRYSQIHFHKTYLDEFGETVNPDITIEVFRTEQSTQPSLILVFECKCLNTKLDIGDYNEFAGNLPRIRKFGVKGYIVTTIGFPQSAINRSHGLDSGYTTGIGLIKFNENGSNWLVERNVRNYAAFQNKIQILLGNKEDNVHPLLYIDGQFVNIIDHFLQLDIDIKGRYRPYVPYLTSQDIFNIAQNIGNKFLPVSLGRLDAILRFITPSSIIIDKPMPSNTLACYNFQEDVLFVSSDLKNNINRRNFSIAHEIGHIVLHKQILTPFFKDTSYCNSTHEASPSDKVINALEIQANKFASDLLLPRNIFLQETARRFHALDIKRPLYWDNQKYNQQACLNVCRYLSSFFQVSIEVIKLKLQEIGLLIVDNRNQPKHINEVLGDFFKTLQ